MLTIMGTLVTLIKQVFHDPLEEFAMEHCDDGWPPLWTIATMKPTIMMSPIALMSLWNSTMDHSIMELSFMITPITLIMPVFRALFAFGGVHNGAF